MKRMLGLGAPLAALLMLVPAPAQADKPVGSCPGDQWQVSVFPLNWQSGDPVDPDGQNLLIQLAIDGFITEFGSVQAGVEAFGFTTFDEFYAGAADPFYNTADRNDDGVLCFKTFPPTSNQPTYLANGVDNNSHS